MILKLFQPEIFICLIVILKLILNTHLIRNSNNNFPIVHKETIVQMFILLIFTLILIFNSYINGCVTLKLFYCDKTTQSIKFLIISIMCLILPFIKNSLTIQKINFVEYDIIFLLSILAGLLLISANDFLAIYILIEMQALSFYVLTTLKRNSAFSVEAGIKYFIFGSIISCIFLIGLGILYGVIGTLSLYDLNLLSLFNYSDDLILILTISIISILILFFFKFGAVPFHFWVPDVYEGAPLASTIIFSIITKPILVHLFIKLIFAFGTLFYLFQEYLYLIGLISILVGTFFTLVQKRFKKIIVYSSITQVGFLIFSLSLNTYDGMVYTYFFLIIYIITSVLIWGTISLLYNFGSKYNIFLKKSNSGLFFSHLLHVFNYNPLFSFLFILIFFSIAGIPPLVGFFSKMFIIFELVYNHLIIFSILIILISSISIFYYIRILKIIFFEKKKWVLIQEFQIIFNINNMNIYFYVLVICQTLLILLFIYPKILLQICQFFVLNSIFL